MITPYRTIEDIKTLSKEQLIDVSKAIHKRGFCAVFYDQDFSEDQIVQMQKRFGECEAPGFVYESKRSS